MKKILKTGAMNGFKTVNQNNIDSLFKFEIKPSPGDASFREWKNKKFDNHRFLSASYDKERAMDVYTVDNPPAKEKSPRCRLEVNGKEAEDVLIFNDPQFFSKTLSGENLFKEVKSS